MTVTVMLAHADPDHAHDHAHHDSAGGHHHAGLPEIEHLSSLISKFLKRYREMYLAVYRLIAEAESAAHDKPVTEVHFHEVGAMDAVADVTAVCVLVHKNWRRNGLPLHLSIWAAVTCTAPMESFRCRLLRRLIC